MARARKFPVLAREGTATPSAVQPDLPLTEVTAARSRPLTPAVAEKLWFCICLPKLSLEACRTTEEATAIVEDQRGMHRILLADAKAQAAGVMPGQSANAALALLPELQLEERSELREQKTLEALASWLERYTSFVCIAERDVLLLEIAGSLRIFGGLQNLRNRIVDDLRSKGFSASFAIAPTPLSATWLARVGRRVCIRDMTNLAAALRKLPLDCLDWPQTLCEALTGVGVTTVGECLRLPRDGFARRFGAERLLQLDRALGHLSDPRSSWRAPERFLVDHEMTEEQSDRELLLALCHELLLRLEHFLLVRQLGTQRVRFSFFHLKGPATELTLGSASSERIAASWLDLLKLRFEKLSLPEPVIAIRLRGGRTQLLTAETARLQFHTRKVSGRRYSITQLAERLSARIGEQSVSGLSTVAEHRPQLAWRSYNLLADKAAEALAKYGDGCKRPLWMLKEPALLRDEQGYPLHQGRLKLLEGPERLETGWWDNDSITRDYYLAVNPAGMRLWVFRNRQRSEAHWYLHGIFG
jgi:protein ImuB